MNAGRGESVDGYGGLNVRNLRDYRGPRLIQPVFHVYVPCLRSRLTYVCILCYSMCVRFVLDLVR